MTKKLLTIGEWNALHKPIMKEGWSDSGIACPKCGQELRGNKRKMNTANLSKRAIYCPNCDHKGSINV